MIFCWDHCLFYTLMGRRGGSGMNTGAVVMWHSVGEKYLNTCRYLLQYMAC